MSAALNRVQLIGRLTHEPELRYTPDGTPVCGFKVATNRYTHKDGEKQELTDYHDVVAWSNGRNKLAELCAEHLTKGRLVYVEGRLQTRRYEQNGERKQRTEVAASDVQFLDSRPAHVTVAQTEADVEAVA